MICPHPFLRLSRDGSAYGPFLGRVGGKEDLVMLIQDGPTHTFGAFVDGKFEQPVDPTQTKTIDHDSSSFFFSVAGAYAKPTKITIPGGLQVDVAGREGVVKSSSSGQPRANFSIGQGDAAALFLGFARPGPAVNLRICQCWIKKAGIR